MGRSGRTLSERIVSVVAEALGEDPMDLPPLEETISADALDYLFHRDNHPPGAYTVFPYCDLWIVAHSTGTVDVFDTYRATSEVEQLPADASEPTTDERMAVLHFEGERYTFSGDQLGDLHRIVSDASTSDEAWDRSIAYARGQAD